MYFCDNKKDSAETQQHLLGLCLALFGGGGERRGLVKRGGWVVGGQNNCFLLLSGGDFGTIMVRIIGTEIKIC